MKTKLTLLALSSSLLLIGCYVERSRGHARGPDVYTQYSYVYYPDAEVYYEPHRHVYYWADGGAWRSGPRVPPTIVLRTHVTVNLDSPEPYRRHDEVRTKYPRHVEDREHGR